MNDHSKSVIPSNIDLFNVNGLIHNQEKRDSLPLLNPESIQKNLHKSLNIAFECSFINALKCRSYILSRQLSYLGTTYSK